MASYGGNSTMYFHKGQGSVASYNPLADLQGRLAEEQWGMQKQLYQQQLESARQGAAGLTSLVDSYNTAYTEAKAANENRYNQMLGIADQTTGQRLADVRSDYGQQQSNAMQALARLGMGNTTVGNAMRAGTEREKQSALNRVADEMQGTKLGIMERRTDSYPDQNLIVALAQALGSSGVGLGGSIQALGNMKLG